MSAVPTRRRKPDLVLSFPSRTEHLALVREVSRSFAEACGFSEQESDGIALATDEAVANVIEHAYRNSGSERVQLRFAQKGEQLKVEIVDQGATIDPRTMPRVDLSKYATERRTGGFGVHLMSKLMDSVTYRRSGRSNVCCLEKRKSRGRG